MFVMALDMLFMAGKATPFEHRVGGSQPRLVRLPRDITVELPAQHDRQGGAP